MWFYGKYGSITRSIADASDKSRPKNTKKGYTPKITEFLKYCDIVYGGEPDPRLVKEEKA